VNARIGVSVAMRVAKRLCGAALPPVVAGRCGGLTTSPARRPTLRVNMRFTTAGATLRLLVKNANKSRKSFALIANPQSDKVADKVCTLSFRDVYFITF